MITQTDHSSALGQIGDAEGWGVSLTKLQGREMGSHIKHHQLFEDLQLLFKHYYTHNHDFNIRNDKSCRSASYRPQNAARRLVREDLPRW